MGSLHSVVELVQEKVENPLDFSRVLKAALHSRGTDVLKFNVSHLYVLTYFPFGIAFLCSFFTIFLFDILSKYLFAKA